MLRTPKKSSCYHTYSIPLHSCFGLHTYLLEPFLVFQKEGVLQVYSGQLRRAARLGQLQRVVERSGFRGVLDRRLDQALRIYGEREPLVTRVAAAPPPPPPQCEWHVRVQHKKGRTGGRTDGRMRTNVRGVDACLVGGVGLAKKTQPR